MPVDVVLVDNDSGVAGFADQVRSRFPSVEVVSLTRNAGYAGAANAGVKRLGAVDLILVITHECRLPRETVELLAQRTASRQDLGAVGPLLVSKRAGTIDSAGGSLDRRLAASHRLRHAPLASAPEAPTEVDWLDGAAIMIRRTAWDSVGGFDESYFLYGEDVDLGIRLRKAGWAIETEPRAVVREESSGMRPGYWQVREQVRRAKLHGTRWQLACLVGRFAFRALRSAALRLRWALVRDSTRAANHRALTRVFAAGVVDGWTGGPPSPWVPRSPSST